MVFRSGRAIVGMASVALLLSGCFAGSPAGDVPGQTRPEAVEKAGDWPLFRGNALQSGVAATRLPERLQIRWKFKAKDGVESTAAIAGGTVYVGSFDQHLYALDLTTGNEKWKYKAGPIKAPVAVRGGAVYVGDMNGVFHCIDAATGKPRWTFDTESNIESGANFAGDAVLFGAENETLYCLGKEGKPHWKFRVPGGPVMASPAVAGNRTFVAGCDSTLHVIDVANGKELGSVDIGGQTGSSTAVLGDTLYVGTMSNQVLAIDWKKVEVLWRYEAAKEAQAFFASAAVTDNLVVTGSRDKRVHAIDRKTGKEAWTFLTGKRVESSPVVVGNRVVAGSLDGNLYVLDLAKGTQLQKIALGDRIAASPAVAGDCLVIGTQEDGTVYCLGK